MIYEQFNPIALTTTKNICFTEHLPLAAFLISQSMEFLFTYLTNSKAPAGKLRKHYKSNCNFQTTAPSCKHFQECLHKLGGNSVFSIWK